MSTPISVPPPLSPKWMNAAVARQRLGIAGRGLFESELATGRLAIRCQRFGKRGLLMLAVEDVERAAQRLAQGVAP